MPSVQIDRVDETAHCGDTISRNTGPPRMVPDDVFIRRQVNAIDFILGDVTVEPMNLRSEGIQGLQGAQRNLPELRI